MMGIEDGVIVQEVSGWLGGMVAETNSFLSCERELGLYI